ncbi:hypothetical protein SCHPADRAFT_309148 [Schizopora paradoxa]|uniref:Uncharacterized protein n=1 Tax=Schizopora paradoxa TaxID=27342 RepID=A0A0H2SC85_9AGAM|nr:hypothetical protein SCHPADRAFT_309148 [Schizopora paradoxa]
MGTARGARLGHGAMDMLKRIILRARRCDGYLDEEDFWYRTPQGFFAPWLLASKSPNSTSKYPWDHEWESLQTSLDALEKLQRHVQHGLGILSRHREQKPRCHILNLPDEVLASIFKFASVTEHTLFETGPSDFDSNLLASSALPISLSSTCRQFRRIALDCSALWTTWHNTDVLGSRKFGERRGTKPLTVYIDTYHPNRRFSKKPILTIDDIIASVDIDIQVAHCLLQTPGDIQTLVVERGGSSQDLAEMNQSNTELKGAYQVESYPLLEELTVIYKDYMQEGPRQFFEDWVMPRLRQVSILNFVPVDKSLIAIGTSLTSLQLVFTKRINAELDESNVSLPDLIRFINRHQSLVELAIRTDIGAFQDTSPPTPPTIIPSIKSFHLHVGGRHVKYTSKYLLQPLQMPSLHTFLLTVECNFEDLSQIASSILPVISTSSSEIQDFKLRLANASRGYADLSTIIDELRSLRSLSISVPNDAEYRCFINMDERLLAVLNDNNIPESSTLPLPLLERIRLHGNAFNPTFLQRLLDGLAAKDPKHLNQIKEVVLRNCSCFDETLEGIYKIIPRDRVIWLDDEYSTV